MARFTASFRSSSARFKAGVRSSSSRFDAGFGSIQTIVDVDDYQGEYVFTPSATVQTIQTQNLRLLDNITINPIPNNYGQIAWDGSILTVR